MPERYSPGVRQRLEAGRYVLAEDYLRALRGREVLRAIVDGALGAYDVLLAPTLPIEAPVIGTTSVTIDGVAEPVRNLMLRLTQPFNVTGHPAISIPCGTTKAGLPAALQLVGKHGLTPELLGIALACEPYVRGDSAT
jgi:aspartyl-tRNA(Asn)/glutamyl-tRNA(Gln) amidotransferase subunit A